MRIKVTRDFIREGQKASNDPITIAISSLLLPGHQVVTDLLRATIFMPDDCYRVFDLPEAATDFTARFRAHLEVKPITFNLKIDQWTVKKISGNC